MNYWHFKEVKIISEKADWSKGDIWLNQKAAQKRWGDFQLALLVVITVLCFIADFHCSDWRYAISACFTFPLSWLTIYTFFYRRLCEIPLPKRFWVRVLLLIISFIFLWQ